MTALPPAGTIIRFDGEHRWLSNFWYCPVHFEGLTYPSLENAYQASKTTDPAIRGVFANIGFNPKAAKSEGKRLKLRPEWNDPFKLHTMRLLLRQKFKLPSLRAKLLGTGHVTLIEGNDWHDTFWGVCHGEGLNHLGMLLMELRAELRRHDGHVGPVRRAPTPADYYDEVNDEQLKRIKETVREAVEEEELEVVDGPAW